MKKIVAHLKIQEYDEEGPNGNFVEYRCSVLPEVFSSVTQTFALGQSLTSWIGTSSSLFKDNAVPHEKTAINREQTVKSLKHLTAMIESGKYECPEVATGYNATTEETNFYFKIKGME